MKQKNFAEDHWVPWVNIVFDENFLFHERSGTAKRRAIVSKKNHVMFYEIGIYIIHIHHHEKNANSPKRRRWPRHKYLIGLKIVDNVIEPQKQPIGKNFSDQLSIESQVSRVVCSRKTLDMSPSHNDENSLDDLDSTGSEPRTKPFQVDYTNPPYHHYHHHHHPHIPHPHHSMKSTGPTDLLDSGGIFKDYHSLWMQTLSFLLFLLLSLFRVRVFVFSMGSDKKPSLMKMTNRFFFCLARYVNI